MTPPTFWSHNGPTARALSPLAALVAAITARRVARPGTRVAVPVICAGNVTTGGAGKTPVVLDLAARLTAAGATPHILSRGYGGRLPGPHRVAPTDTARDTGDEPQLLARAAPTWIGADRLASARAAIAAGADLLLMDDGMQNPSLHKTLTLLVLDPANLGNGRVLPAGPLREPLASGLARASHIISFGDTPDPRTLRARLVPGPATRALEGQTVFAFAGIGRPEKFFQTLRDAGAILAGTKTFPDHHRFTETEVATIRAAAGPARPVTTAKDAVRLHPWPGLAIADVELAWTDPPDALIAAILAARTP